MLHFFVLAALLFALEQYFAAGQKTPIVIDQATADYLIRQREDLELRALSAEERAETIDAYVEDEILYNEAYRRGLDRGDSRMRRNMILKMRGLLTGDLAEPTEAELVSYFEANRERFRRPERLELEHLHFRDPATVPTDLAAALNGGLDATTVGDDGMQFSRRMPGMTRRLLSGTFGAEVARSVLAIEDDNWHGPFESAQGAHLFRILGRTPAMEADFQTVRQYLQGDWLMAESRRAIRNEVDGLLGDYEVRIEAEL
ncbi:MAG: peptidylprolyl isomerase [Pseudomonadota bacterium]